MKTKKILFLGLLLFSGILSVSSQCAVEVGNNNTIVCGASVQIQADAKWGKGLDSLLYNFHSVFFVNSDTGYIVGVDGTIRKTLNGGTSWVTQTSNTHAILESVFLQILILGIL